MPVAEHADAHVPEVVALGIVVEERDRHVRAFRIAEHGADRALPAVARTEDDDPLTADERRPETPVRLDAPAVADGAHDHERENRARQRRRRRDRPVDRDRDVDDEERNARHRNRPSDRGDLFERAEYPPAPVQAEGHARDQLCERDGRQQQRESPRVDVRRTEPQRGASRERYGPRCTVNDDLPTAPTDEQSAAVADASPLGRHTLPQNKPEARAPISPSHPHQVPCVPKFGRDWSGCARADSSKRSTTASKRRKSDLFRRHDG